MNCESKKYRRIVVKIGSNVLTREDGRPDTTRISALVDQLARLHRAGTEFILVSSGAVVSNLVTVLIFSCCKKSLSGNVGCNGIKFFTLNLRQSPHL